jgi:Transposase, Mutator family
MSTEASALPAELSEHFGYGPHREPPGDRQHAQRLDGEDACDRARPGRDQNAAGSHRQLRAAAGQEGGQRRFEGFDEKILAGYSRGLSTGEIEANLAEIYGVKVGRDLISRVTEAVARAAGCSGKGATSRSASRSRASETCSIAAATARAAGRLGPVSSSWRSRGCAGQLLPSYSGWPPAWLETVLNDEKEDKTTEETPELAAAEAAHDPDD